jgi:hypothetical protein
MCAAMPPYLHVSLQRGDYLTTGKILHLPYSYTSRLPLNKQKY